MADEISQKLGFDASAAITTLANLEKSISALNTSVGASPATFSAFNAKAGKTVAALKHLSSNAKTAATDLQKVLNLQGKVSTLASPKQGSAPGAAKAAAPVVAPDLSRYLAELDKIYKKASQAPTLDKRSFESAKVAVAEMAQKYKLSVNEMITLSGKLGTELTGTSNKVANAMATLSKKATVKPPDLSAYIKRVQLLIPLTEGATRAQTRAWQSMATKIASTAKTAGMSVNEMASVYGRLGSSLTGTSNKVANEMQKMESSSKKLSKTWTISWETMARVVGTQFIVRALTSVRTALKSSIANAVKFQRAVAEIGTIGREMGGLDNIAEMATRVSDAFNIQLSDTSEAAYQTISNQIAGAEAAVESFLGQAAKFSKITKTDMATSVNLLSGTLNAFGKEVSDTEEVAAKFFKTIELGRTRAEELALGYGTVAPIADKLGISMEELNASVATLTINGIQTDKAFTQIRGTMQGFLKPTTEMKNAMAELGFATGEQVLEAYNLQEAIRAVTGTTDMNAAAVAKLFPRIRGLTGVLGLASDKNEHFTRTLDEQREALERTYDEAYELVIETPAEKITKDLNKIKNYFTTEFGQGFLDATSSMSQFVGGADRLLAVMRTLQSTVIPLIGGVTVFGVTMVGATAKNWLFASSANGAAIGLTKMNAAIGILAIAAAALMALDVYQNFKETRVLANIEDIKRANDEVTLGLKKAVDEQFLVESEAVSKRVKLHAQLSAENRQAYMGAVATAKEANIALVDSSDWALDGLMKVAKAAAKGISEAAAQIDRAISQTMIDKSSVVQSVQDKLFQRSVQRVSDPLEQIKLLKTRSDQEMIRSQKLMESALTESDKKLAMSVYDRAQALGDQAYSIAASNDEQAAMRQLNQQTVQQSAVMTKGLDAYSQRLENSEKSLAANAKSTSVWLAELEALSSSIKDLRDKASDGALSFEQQELNKGEAAKQIDKFIGVYNQKAEEFGKSAEPLMQKLFADVTASEEMVEVQTLLALPDNMSSIYTEVKNALDALQKADPLLLEIKAYAAQEGIDIGTEKGYSEAAKGLRDSMVEAPQLTKEAAKTLIDYKDELKDAAALAEVFHVPRKLGSDQALAGLVAIGEEMTTISKKGLESREQLLEIQKMMQDWKDARSALGQATIWSDEISGMRAWLATMDEVIRIKETSLKEQGGNSPWSRGDSDERKVAQAIAQIAQASNVLMDREIAQRKEAEASATRLLETQKSLTVATAETTAAQQTLTETKPVEAIPEEPIKPVLDLDTQPFIMKVDGVNVELDRLPQKVMEGSQAAGQLTSAVSSVGGAANGVATSVDGITSSLGSSISAAQQLVSILSQAQSMEGSVAAAKGGRMTYLASGGRGTDTIPAMLAPGEFVTNAKSSQRFFTQLQAMNAGKTPVYRESGGSTTNIADVSINVNESSSPRQTGRAVMNTFRREVRRGSGRI